MDNISSPHTQSRKRKTFITVFALTVSLGELLGLSSVLRCGSSLLPPAASPRLPLTVSYSTSLTPSTSASLNLFLLDPASSQGTVPPQTQPLLFLNPSSQTLRKPWLLYFHNTPLTFPCFSITIVTDIISSLFCSQHAPWIPLCALAAPLHDKVIF